MAGAKTSTPVRLMKSTATSRLCSVDASSEPMSSSTPLMHSISPSTWAPCARASATTSIVCREVLGDRRARGRRRARSSSPRRRHSVITSRSGQWSRCSATGTSMSAVHRPEHADQPVTAVGADGLDRGLQDDRRALLLGGGEHRLDRQVVEDVERGDPVPLARTRGPGSLSGVRRARGLLFVEGSQRSHEAALSPSKGAGRGG